MDRTLCGKACPCQPGDASRVLEQRGGVLQGRGFSRESFAGSGTRDHWGGAVGGLGPTGGVGAGRCVPPPFMGTANWVAVWR